MSQRYKKNTDIHCIFNFRKFCALALALLLAVGACSQSKTVVIDDGRISIGQAFKKIEKQTGYYIVLDNNAIDLSKRIELPRTATNLDNMLDLILAGTDCSYKFRGKNIAIIRSAESAAPEESIVPEAENAILPDETKSAVATESASPKAVVPVATQTVRGVVFDDETNCPIAGAKISLSGIIGKEAETDDAGQFSIYGVPVGVQCVRISKEGYYLSERGMNVSAHRADQMRIPIKTTSATPSRTLSEADNGSIVTAEMTGMTIDTLYDYTYTPTAIKPDTATVPVVETRRAERLLPYPSGINRYDTKLAVKTNLLYWATLSPNIGVEWRIAPQWTAEVTGGFNLIKWNSDLRYNHWLVKPEVRYWLCRPFDGHFFGVHGIAGKFRVSDMIFDRMFPLGFTKKLEKDKVYQGWGYGAGIDYGYQWAIGKRWNLEAAIGVGYMRFEYDRYTLYDDCKSCHGRDPRNYFGITKLGVSLLYIIK